MDRFFFHIDYGQHFRDSEGTAFPDLRAARGEAVRLLGELLRDEGDEFWTKPNVKVTVTDATGLVLWTLETSGQQSPAVSAGRRS